MKKYILTALLLAGFTAAFGQVTIGSTAQAHPSAIVELVSTNKGLLPPRMTTAQRNAIISPAAGLTIYNTTEKCLNFYNSSGWASACGAPFYPVTQPVNFRLGGNGNEGFGVGSVSKLQTADGGYIIAGYTVSSASGDVAGTSKGGWDVWVVKLKADGTIDWEKNYGGSLTDFASSIQQTLDGGYIVAANTQSSASGDVTGIHKGGSRDVWILKLDALGNIIWQKNYGGNNEDIVQSIKQTKDGGYIFAGRTESSASGDVTGINKGGSDWWIVKLDAVGNITWQKNYGGSGNWEWAYFIEQTTDGGYIVTGNTNSSASGDVTASSKGSDDVWIVKLDIVGNITWQKNYGGSGQDFSSSIKQTTDGGYIVTGNTHSSASGDVTGVSKGTSDAWVIKLDASGNIAWQKNYGGSGSDVAQSIQQTAEGDYIVAGYTASSASGDVTGTSKGSNDVWVVKLNASGTIVWQKSYGGSGSDVAQSIQQTTDGNYAVAGYSDNNSAGNGDQARLTSKGNFDIWFFTIDANGNLMAP